MLKLIDSFLDKITMYRLLLYYLIALLLVAVVFGQTGQLHISSQAIIFSSLVLFFACLITNKVFAYIFNAPTNIESTYLTALILALIVPPTSTLSGVPFLLAVSGLAISSKYLLTINHKHIFNPAAIAVVLTAFGPKQAADWWIGTQIMLPFVIIGGLLMLRKLRRFTMVLAFFAATIVSSSIFTLLLHGGLLTDFKILAYSTPMFFMGFVMLTEPMTSPPTSKKQLLYGILAGGLFPPQVHIFNVYSTPELVLVIGNIFSYIVSPKTKLFPILKQKLKLTPDTLDFVFAPGKNFAFQPGQYMEFTLPHNKTDSRGNRRYFTLASSPTESDLHIGVKFYNPSSSYKKAMLKMTQQTPFVASQIAGDFVLPKNPSEKLAFIAGGIGITPFRSMVKYLMDTNQSRVISLIYSVRTPDQIAYKELFEEARQKVGMHITYKITDKGAQLPDIYSASGYITAETIKADIPDYQERTFYISGTHRMVTSMESILKDLGVAESHIKTDFFPGYV
jgi:glycine betaine catabolism B